MIYKRKHDEPVKTIRRVPAMLASVTGPDMPEFPIVITKDENVAYYKVWEVEEFDEEDLGIGVTIGDKGKVLLEGTLLVER